MLLSAAGDSSARLWSMESGEELFRFRFNEPARACKFSVGERQAAISTDPFMNSVSAIRVFNIAEDPRDMLQVGAGQGGWRSGSSWYARAVAAERSVACYVLHAVARAGLSRDNRVCRPQHQPDLAPLCPSDLLDRRGRMR